MRYPLPSILTRKGPDWGHLELPNGEPVDKEASRTLFAGLISTRFRKLVEERGFEVTEIDRFENFIETTLPIELLDELADDAFESVWTDLDDGIIQPIPLNKTR